MGLLAQTHHEQLGRQRLVGVPGRALRLAAAALRARGEVEQALPREVFDLADAEGSVFVQVFDQLEVERLAVDDDGLQRTQGGAPVRVPLEPDVEERQEPVPRDAHCGLGGDRDHPRVGDEDLDRRHEHDGRAQ